MPVIGVRVDAKSESMGMQYVIRCISLAIELGKLYYDVYFFTKFEASFNRIKKAGFNVFRIDDTASLYEGTKRKTEDLLGENPKELIELFKKHDVTTLIIDLPYISENYIRTYRQHLKHLILIEDHHKFNSHADVIINGNLHATDIEFPEVPFQMLLTGSEYCLLDDNISHTREVKRPKVLKEILVYVSTHDKYNMTPILMNAILEDPTTKNLRVHTICDANFPGIEQINQLSEKYSRNVVLHSFEESFLKIMSEVHIGITNELYSIYRFLALGVPVISFIEPEPDSQIIDPLNEIVENIWEHKYIGLIAEEANIEKSLIKKINKLIESHSMYNTLSDRGRKTFDGLGAFRVAEKLRTILK